MQLERGPEMRLSYDPEADAIYLKVSDARIDLTTEIAPDVFVDLTADGDLVGIEILRSSSGPGAEPMKLAFGILDGSKRQTAE
jgi:uncharacterized protein YuzE